VSALNEIVKLQKRLKKLGRKCDESDCEIEELTAEYGYREDIETRLEEISENLNEIIHIAAEEHGEFDSRHSVTHHGQTIRFKAVPGCADCDSISEAHGLADLIEELKSLRWAQRRLEKLEDRRDDMDEEYQDLLTQINDLGQTLGMPSFEVRWDERHGLVGLITQVGPIQHFKVNRRTILEEGLFANYYLDGHTARAIFDASEQLVAYHLGDGNWTVTATWEKYRTSADHDTGLSQTDFFAGTIGERDQKKKVHIAIDESGDVIFVRDIDGEVLYDRKHGKGFLPPDLNWDH
jgi:hypothetical protein